MQNYRLQYELTFIVRPYAYNTCNTQNCIIRGWMRDYYSLKNKQEYRDNMKNYFRERDSETGLIPLKTQTNTHLKGREIMGALDNSEQIDHRKGRDAKSPSPFIANFLTRTTHGHTHVQFLITYFMLFICLSRIKVTIELVSIDTTCTKKTKIQIKLKIVDLTQREIKNNSYYNLSIIRKHFSSVNNLLQKGLL